jgi:hypothetical protein
MSSALDRVFAELGQNSKKKACEAMKGLIKEGEEQMEIEAGPVFTLPPASRRILPSTLQTLAESLYLRIGVYRSNLYFLDLG